MVTSDILNNIIDNSPWRNYLHDIYCQTNKQLLYYEHVDVVALPYNYEFVIRSFMD
jgi:hypothetical protein